MGEDEEGEGRLREVEEEEEGWLREVEEEREKEGRKEV